MSWSSHSQISIGRAWSVKALSIFWADMQRKAYEQWKFWAALLFWFLAYIKIPHSFAIFLKQPLNFYFNHSKCSASLKLVLSAGKPHLRGYKMLVLFPTVSFFCFCLDHGFLFSTPAVSNPEVFPPMYLYYNSLHSVT